MQTSFRESEFAEVIFSQDIQAKSPLPQAIRKFGMSLKREQQ